MLIPIDILLVTRVVHHEKQRDYDLDYQISLAATFLDTSGTEDCIHSHHLSSTMRPMDFGQVNCIERQQFPKIFR